jgi:hypothetical protein
MQLPKQEVPQSSEDKEHGHDCDQDFCILFVLILGTYISLNRQIIVYSLASLSNFYT